MNRHERDYDYRNNYGRYEGYDRDDNRYHGARNLTNQFERHYQQEHDDWQGNRGYHPREQSYHEGDMNGAYERFQNRRDRDRGTGYDHNDYPRNNWDYSEERGYRHDWNNSEDRGPRNNWNPDIERRWFERHSTAPFDREGSHNNRWESHDRHSGTGRDTRRARYEDRGRTHWSNPDRDRYEVNRYY